MSFIPFSSPTLGESERAALLDAFDQGWISTAGPYVPRFEQSLSQSVGGIPVLATQSGTSALHLALIAAGVGPKDLVLAPALSFIAPANAVKYVGASLAFFDCDPQSLQLDLDAVEDFLSAHERQPSGLNPRAILAVHTLGNTIPMRRLRELADRFSLVVIEDASQSFGAQVDGRPVGTWGDLATLSFNGNKIITTGGGGAVITHEPEWMKKMASLANQAKSSLDDYAHEAVGFNYRMTSLSAAIGIAQLNRLPEFIGHRRAIGDFYRRELHDKFGLRMVARHSSELATDWMPVVRFPNVELRKRIATEWWELGVPTRRLWEPLHRSRAHPESFGLPSPNALEIYETSLALPSSSYWSPETFEQLAERLAKGLRAG